MTERTLSSSDNDLVKIAYANDESEAELLQGLLRTVDVGSVLRRAPGFDAPEFGSAGPRDVLVAASDVPVARDVLREVDQGESGPGEREPTRPSGADRRTRVLAGLLIVVALATAVVCLATDVIV